MPLKHYIQKIIDTTTRRSFKRPLIKCTSTLNIILVILPILNDSKSLAQVQMIIAFYSYQRLNYELPLERVEK